MRTHMPERVQKHRMMLRTLGLRPIQVWVPDTRRIEFTQSYRQQSLLAAASDREATELKLMDFMEKTLADVEGCEA